MSGSTSSGMQGTARDIGGRAQETVGSLTGDTKTQAQGLYNQAAGQVQQATGQFSEMVKSQPIASALIALGIGYILGRLTA